MSRKGQFDNSDLSIDVVEDTHLIHRDYFAHCMRWSYVLKWLTIGGRWRDAVVFDIGAGKDLPLFKLICSNRLTKTEYRGVDINKLELPHNFSKRSVKCTLHSEQEFLNLPDTALEGTTLFTSFEVLEHMPAKYARNTAERVYDQMSDDAYFMMSTPVYREDKGPADNHINEMKRDALGYLLEDTGFEIVENFGTFGDQRDIKPHLTPAELEVFDKILPYYHHHVFATILAPLYPQYSRNNMWVLKKRDNLSPRLFPNKPEGPWTQGEDWKDLLIERNNSETML